MWILLDLSLIVGLEGLFLLILDFSAWVFWAAVISFKEELGSYKNSN